MPADLLIERNIVEFASDAMREIVGADPDRMVLGNSLTEDDWWCSGSSTCSPIHHSLWA